MVAGCCCAKRMCVWGYWRPWCRAFATTTTPTAWSTAFGRFWRNGLAMGYEGLNDHHELRPDSLLAVLVGETDREGRSRVHRRNRGYPLAGLNKLNRLELVAACVGWGRPAPPTPERSAPRCGRSD